MTGFSDVLVGVQYGDEGKAKVVDVISGEYDIIARFNGGMNAGHTVSVEQKTVTLRQLPSGVMRDGVQNYIGTGCVMNVSCLIDEIQQVINAGFDVYNRLKISRKVGIVQPHHIQIDKLTGDVIGTTKNGIGPCYSDRATRANKEQVLPITIQDLIDFPEESKAKIVSNYQLYSKLYGYNVDSEYLNNFCEKIFRDVLLLKECVVSNQNYLTTQVSKGAKVLFEGAQSIKLDVFHGDYPFVTSSHTVPAYAYVGGDLPIRFHRKTIGVAKAIESRVGNGPFAGEFGGERSAKYCDPSFTPGISKATEQQKHEACELIKSEDEFDIGVAIRMVSGEYGSGSGRPRRLRALELDELKETISQFGIDELYINKFDVLEIFLNTKFKAIPVLVKGQYKFFNCVLEGKQDVLLKVGAMKELISYLEEYLGVQIVGLGFGASRADNVNLKAN